MKQVLYVEDSATSQLIMRKYLADLCELTITPSLRMAVSHLAERRFDLLISDFLFPEGDALELIQQVRKMQATKAMPIIVVSSSMDSSMMSRVLKAGANEGLAKPLTMAEFRAVVIRMLEAPYVRSVEHAVSTVTCFQWTLRGVISQFCPELNITVSGKTEEDVSKLMQGALRDRFAQGTELGYTNHEIVVTHLVQGN
jgi:CheY-like chemotaxis protein